MKTRTNSQHLSFNIAYLLLTVVASHETKGVVDKVSCKTNKAAGDRVRRCHLGDTVVHQTKEAGIDSVREEQAAWTALVETAADTDEESSSNGTTNGHELNLSVSKPSVEVIIVLNDLAFFVAVGASDWLGRHKVVHLLTMFVRCHV